MKTQFRSTATTGLALIAAFSLLGPPRAEAQINYQGHLTDETGAPMPDGQTTITFSLWDAATGGTKVWGDHVLDGGGDDGHGPKADLVNGRFNVIIGNLDTEGRSLTTAMDTDASLHLQIEVAGEPPITPRQAILAAPRALMADRVRDDSVTKASLIQEVADALCPPGSIIAFGGPAGNVPSGWLLCDGSALKSADYGRLSGAIGISWGDGSNDADDDTDFNLPDLRGVFLRGVNGTRDDAYQAPKIEATHNITAVTATSVSEAVLTIDAEEPFPAMVDLTVAGLAASGATIPDGNYSATRITATTWSIAGGTDFTVGAHVDLDGTATGISLAKARIGADGTVSYDVGSFQSRATRAHRHRWGEYSSGDHLFSWNQNRESVLTLQKGRSHQIAAGIHHDYDDWMITKNVEGGFWTEPVPSSELSGIQTETRPTNAAVHYIIKY